MKSIESDPIDFTLISTIQNKNSSGGGSLRKSDEEANPLAAILAAGGAVLIALAVAAWKFAQYAPLIYLTLKVVVLVIVGIKMATTIALYSDQPKSWLIDQALGSGAVVLVGIGVWMSAGGYRFELTEMALRAAQWKDFFCGLKPYGMQVATFHMLTMSLLAVPALVFASFGALGALARWGFFVTGFGFLGHVARFQHRGGVVASLIFATLCLGSQLDVVQAIWAEQFAGSKTVFHYLCVR